MSNVAATQPDQTFASGRYSKRKRTQITYTMDELDVSDSESDFESPQSKKRKATKVPRPLPKHKIFPFMELPAEIRNMIYTYALVDPSGINFVATFKHRRRTVERVSAECQSKLVENGWSPCKINNQTRAEYEAPMALNASLLATNKQIYQEARDIFYGNEFVFADSFALYAFMINLGPSGAKLIKNIRLLSWGQGRAMKTYNHCCFAVLVWATNITTFQIDAHLSPNQFYRDAFPWLEAMGAAKGKADAAVDVLRFGEFCFHYWRRNTTQQDEEQEIEEFKTKLSKLLCAQQKRVMATPMKKKKLSEDDL